MSSFDLLSSFSQFIQKHHLLAGGEQVIAGVSGGPDSICLLHLLSRYCREHNRPGPVVAHLNHRLRGAASQADAAFVQGLAQEWGLPVIIESRDVAQLAVAHSQSVEEAGRQARYLFLWQAAQKVGATKIAVGHNADDQAETVLMHLLRGSGLSGLGGMLPSLSLAKLYLPPAQTANLASGSVPQLIRPMLDLTRQQIERYCQEHHLATRQDATNQQPDYLRNRLRHEALPYLEGYNPKLRQTLNRLAKIVAAEVEFREQVLDQTWPTLTRHLSQERVEFHRLTWRALPPALRRASLRRAIEIVQGHALDIGFEHIEAAIDVIDGGRVGAQVTLPGGLLFELDYDTFSLVRADSGMRVLPDTPRLGPSEVVPVKIPGQTPLPHSEWQLVAELLPGKRLANLDLARLHPWEAYLDAASFGPETLLRPRRPGDRFQPLGMSQFKKIKAFMIDQKIPASQRNQIPLLVSANKVLWVCGYRLDERARVGPKSQHVVHLKFGKVV